MGSTTRNSRLLYAVLGVAAILVGWQLLSFAANPALFASPANTAKALASLAWGSRLWIQLLITLEHLVVGLAMGVAFGFALGVLAGLDRRVRSFLEPLRWVGMTVPAVIIAALAGLWLGLGDLTVILIVALIVWPTMYVNTVSGILAIDPRLVEMGRIYRFPRMLFLTEVYLPGIASPVMAGLTLSTGTGVRAVVLAELLGALSGIGHAFYRADSNLDAPQMFAWVVVLLALLAAIEFAVLRRARRRVTRWRKAAQ